MSPEVPFFMNRRRRAGLVRRVGNLAAALKTQDNELVAMEAEMIRPGISNSEKSHIKQMIACHLEFVADLSPAQARQLALSRGVQIEYANLPKSDMDPAKYPEVVGAALADVAAIVKRSME